MPSDISRSGIGHRYAATERKIPDGLFAGISGKLGINEDIPLFGCGTGGYLGSNLSEVRSWGCGGRVRDGRGPAAAIVDAPTTSPALLGQQSSELWDRLDEMPCPDAFADRLELPNALGANYFARDQAGRRSAAAEVVAGDLGAGDAIDHAAERVLDLCQGLPRVRGDEADHGDDLWCQPDQVDGDYFLVALAFSGDALAEVVHRAVFRDELSVVDGLGDLIIGEQ